MRRGVLVMGQNKKPLTEDVKSIPKLIIDFGDEVRRLLLERFHHHETATRRLTKTGRSSPIALANP